MSTSIGSSTGTGTAAASTALASPGAAGGSDAQDRFLKLLVTQLKNQDPLNPMDNAQITTQMAQISTVSGIDRLNTTLQGLASGQSLQAAAMIGHGVLAPGSALQLQEGRAQGGVELGQAVDKLVVSISDASGQALHKVDLGPQKAGLVSFEWDGVGDSGAQAASGSYSFAAEAVQDGKKVKVTALSHGQVGSVTLGADGVMLNVNGVGSVALSDVKRVM